MPTRRCLHFVVIFAYLVVHTCAHTTQVCKKRNVETIKTGTTNVVGAQRQFAKFINETDIWADKSLLIDSILKQNKTILIISSPRGWYRSHNLHMLHTFFSIVTDRNNGSRIPVERTFSYNYFVKGRIHLLEGTVKRIIPSPLISQHQDVINKYQGQTPVIFLDFSRRLTGIDESIRCVISEAYESNSHAFGIIESSNITIDLKNRAEKCKQITRESPGNMTTAETLQCIQTLSELLFKCHGRKVVILIDEYDTFIQTQYFNVYNTFNPHEESAVTSFYKLFSEYTLRSNIYLEKAVITTVLAVGGILGMKDEDTVEKYNLIDGDEIYTFFGLTQPEISDMMKHRGINDSLKDDMIKWYGGYNCPKSPSGYVFSAASVTKYLEKKLFDIYYDTSISVEFVLQLRRYPVFFDTVNTLIRNETYYLEYEKILKLNNSDCALIHSFVKNVNLNKDDFKQEHCDTALALLGGMGFVTADVTFANYGKNATHIRVKIPNEEIRVYTQKRIQPQQNQTISQ